MHHNDDVSVFGESFAVAGLLIAAITIVAVVHKVHQAELARNFHGPVRAEIIDQDAGIHDVRQLLHGHGKRLLGVVCRHYYSYTFSIQHR